MTRSFVVTLACCISCSVKAVTTVYVATFQSVLVTKRCKQKQLNELDFRSS